MAEKAPAAEQPYLAGDTTSTPWAEARKRLADSDTYWLATVRQDWLPHLVPLLAVWVDDALHFVASPTSRKARNLARPALRHHGEERPFRSGGRRHGREGERRSQAPSHGRGVHDQVRVAGKRARRRFLRRGGADRRSAPYEVYEVTPTMAFGFPWDETFRPTRWRF